MKIKKENRRKEKGTSKVFRFKDEDEVGGVFFRVSTEGTILDAVFPCNSMFCSDFLNDLISFPNVEFDRILLAPVALH